MMKQIPLLLNDEMARAVSNGSKTQTRKPVKPQPTAEHGLIFQGISMGKFGSGSNLELASPYGDPGDMLYVREAFAIARATMHPDCEIDELSHIPKTKPKGWGICYRATAPSAPVTWRPNIHMPKWAARTWLRVNRVWVERIQDISPVDAIAEGITDDHYHPNPFSELWGRIYPGSWSRNDWVWCCEFAKEYKELSTKTQLPGQPGNGGE